MPNCKDCVFATFDEDSGVQNNCLLDKIESLRTIAGNITLSGGVFEYPTACVSKRTNQWAYHHLPKIVDKENTPRIQYIILANNKTEFDILTTVDTALKQTIKPHLISIVLDTEGYSAERLWDSVKAHQCVNVVKVMEKPSALSQSLFLAAQKEANYYAVFSASFYIPPGFGQSIKDAITNWRPFVLLRPNDAGQGLTLLSKAYWTATLGSVEHFMENIEGLVESMEQPELIRSVEDVCRL